MMMHEGATTATATTTTTTTTTTTNTTNTNAANSVVGQPSSVNLQSASAAVASSSPSSSLIQLLNNHQHHQQQLHHHQQQQQQQQQSSSSLVNASSANNFINNMIQQETQSLNFTIKLNKDNSFSEHQQRKIEMLESRFAPVNTQKIEFSKVSKHPSRHFGLVRRWPRRWFMVSMVTICDFRAFRRTSPTRAWPRTNRKTTYSSQSIT